MEHVGVMGARDTAGFTPKCRTNGSMNGSANKARLRGQSRAAAAAVMSVCHRIDFATTSYLSACILQSVSLAKPVIDHSARCTGLTLPNTLKTVIYSAP